MSKLKKDAYYFSHDANAQEDPKCIILIEQLGMEGFGLFWGLVERLRMEKNYKLPLTILPALARIWNSSRVKKSGLFEIENDSFFSLRLLRSMEEYEEKKKKLVEAGRKGGKASVDRRLGNHQPLVGQPLTIKENEIKEKEKKKNI
jgi:general stress protein YciG